MRSADRKGNEKSASGTGADETARGPGVPGKSEPDIRIDKCRVPAEVGGRPADVELFTLTLGDESIYLVPLKTWSQLDVYKWRAQGKLPGTPPGLDIALDHVKIGGESVEAADPEACAKLERAFNEWLTVERQALEKAKKHNAQSPATLPAAEEEALRFEVAMDKTGQAHIRCFEGKEKVADVACTTPGMQSLINDGLMRKPGTWKVGALRDWLELEGEVFRLKDGESGLAALQRALNGRYHPATAGGATQEVKVFANPASSTGFDIVFPAAENGLTEVRRRHLDVESMQLLSDSHRCRVLRKDVVVKFTPPTFHFKQKLPDGGELDLEASPENIVLVQGEDGCKKWINLSEPVSHLGLGAAELTTIFNHPSICRRVKREEGHRAGDLPQAA